MIDIDAIRARCDAATPGPWGLDGGGLYVELDGYPVSLETKEGPNAEFIAHAREDIPALIAEVRRLRDENQELLEDLRNEYGGML